MRSPVQDLPRSQPRCGLPPPPFPPPLVPTSTSRASHLLPRPARCPPPGSVMRARQLAEGAAEVERYRDLAALLQLLANLLSKDCLDFSDEGVFGDLDSGDGAGQGAKAADVILFGLRMVSPPRAEAGLPQGTPATAPATAGRAHGEATAASSLPSRCVPDSAPGLARYAVLSQALSPVLHGTGVRGRGVHARPRRHGRRGVQRSRLVPGVRHQGTQLVPLHGRGTFRARPGCLHARAPVPTREWTLS